jgi:hypothetical protein
MDCIVYWVQAYKLQSTEALVVTINIFTPGGI